MLDSAFLGQGIRSAHVEAAPRVDTSPPCCGSVMWHLPICLLVHPEIAALPEVLPADFAVGAAGPFVEIAGRWLVSPDEARAVARALLLAAHVVERGEQDG